MVTRWLSCSPTSVPSPAVMMPPSTGSGREVPPPPPAGANETPSNSSRLTARRGMARGESHDHRDTRCRRASRARRSSARGPARPPCGRRPRPPTASSPARRRRPAPGRTRARRRGPPSAPPMTRAPPTRRKARSAPPPSQEASASTAARPASGERAGHRGPVGGLHGPAVGQADAHRQHAGDRPAPHHDLPRRRGRQEHQAPRRAAPPAPGARWATPGCPRCSPAAGPRAGSPARPTMRPRGAGGGPTRSGAGPSPRASARARTAASAGRRPPGAGRQRGQRGQGGHDAEAQQVVAPDVLEEPGPGRRQDQKSERRAPERPGEGPVPRPHRPAPGRPRARRPRRRPGARW